MMKKTPLSDYKKSLPLTLFISLSLALAIFSLIYLKLDYAKIASRAPKLIKVFGEMSHFSFDHFSLTLTAMAETISVSLIALIYGVILGIPLGALAASNITPFKPLSVALKCFCAFLRAVPTPVWVLLALASMGFGMPAGIVGLGFHVVAFFGKAFSQLFEEVPEGTIEAIRATGAGPAQIFFGAVLPASLSGIIAWTALRYETNYVEAAILGMVGAGGIGYTILAAMSSYKFGRAGLAVVIVFLFAIFVELLTTLIKQKTKA